MPHPCERRWIQNHREQIRESNKIAYRKWKLQNPKKHKASHNAYRDLPIGAYCSRCGSTENLERHHPDYSKFKEVITMCRNCHLKLHGEKRNETAQIA